MTFYVEHSGLFATAMLYRVRHNIRVLQKLRSPRRSTWNTPVEPMLISPPISMVSMKCQLRSPAPNNVVALVN